MVIELNNKDIKHKRDETTGEWKKLHNGELYDLYSSPNTILALKLRSMRQALYVAHMGEK
jgi:hypothetical protein